MNLNETIEQAKQCKPEVFAILQKLHKTNKYDHYWSEVIEMSKKPDFFEPCLMQYWIGKNYHPKRILEIGTRTGGSLIPLLSPYSSFENVEIFSFDIWKENINATIFKKIPVLRFLIKRSFLNLILAHKVVKRNLDLFSIPSGIIKFKAGDSKKTVPDFFDKNPGLVFDYVLVDGAHDTETAYIDLENVSPHLAPSGYLLFDDISPISYNLISVWEKFKNNHGSEFQYFESMHRKGLAWAIKVA